MNPLELEQQRRQTEAFINADSTTLSVLRGVREPTDAGGYRDVVPTEPNVGPVLVRLIPTSDKTPELRTSAGRMVVPTYTLLAMPDADLARWDKFKLGEDTYELANILDEWKPADNKYELKGDVVIVVNV